MARPYCIAEIGGNHQGSFQKAIELTKLAIGTPVDSIKFQTYFADSLVERSADPERWAHFKKFELSIEQHKELAEMVIASGKDYISSIWDQSSYAVLSKYMRYVKVGSGDLTSYTFLRLAASTKKPIILSTGLSTNKEVHAAVKLLRDFDPCYNNKDMLTLLQCTSMYPIPYAEANLAVMNQFSKYDCRVGYSDHTVGSRALEVAATLGAEVLEFHFTDNKENIDFRDHQVSLESSDVCSLYKFFDELDELIGSDFKEPTDAEIESGHVKSFRRGVYASRDLLPGDVIAPEDLIEKRPDNDGLRYLELVGRTLTNQVVKGAMIRRDDI